MNLRVNTLCTLIIAALSILLSTMVPLTEGKVFPKITAEQTPVVDHQPDRTARGDSGRSGFFNTRGVETPTDNPIQSPKLFEMKRERIVMEGGSEVYTPSGHSFFFMGTTYKHSYGFGFSDPVVAGNDVFFSLFIGDGYLYSLDASTGAVNWVTKLVKGRFSEPAVAGSKLFVGASSGLFYAIDLKNQRELWRDDLKDKSFVTGSPIVDGNFVYFGRNNGVVYALNTETGKPVWTYNSLAESYLTDPILADGRLYFANWKKVFALESQTGKEVWSYTPGKEVFTVLTADGIVYVVDLEGTIYSLNSATGKPTNFSGKYGRTSHVLAAAHKTLYLRGWNTGDVIAVDAQTAKTKWKFNASQCNAPSISQNRVYVTCSDGKLHALDVATGKKLWETAKVKPELSSPFVADSAIYFISDDGRLHGIR